MRQLHEIQTAAVPPSPQGPLVVELDGTLVRTDTLHESLLLRVLVHRGAVDEGPILFALKDRVSYGVGGLALCILYFAAGR